MDDTQGADRQDLVGGELSGGGRGGSPAATAIGDGSTRTAIGHSDSRGPLQPMRQATRGGLDRLRVFSDDGDGLKGRSDERRGGEAVRIAAPSGLRLPISSHLQAQK